MTSVFGSASDLEKISQQQVLVVDLWNTSGARDLSWSCGNVGQLNIIENCHSIHLWPVFWDIIGKLVQELHTCMHAYIHTYIHAYIRLY